MQYKCQMKLNNPVVSLVLNIASLPMIIFYFKKKNLYVMPSETKADAIFFADGKTENIIPSVLRKAYDHWITIEKKGEFLQNEDKAFFLSLIKRYPFSWHFQLKCLIKIRFYSYVIERYEPKAIIVCNEYSFTSSMLTEYCRRRGIKHINVMHGEKLYYMRDSFFHFDECYVWDKCYVELFEKLRADSSQFIIAVPDSLIFLHKGVGVKEVDYTYYFAAEKGVKAARVLDSLFRLVEKGFIVAVRPHPRYSDVEEIYKLCKGRMEVEDFDAVTIENSILRTKNAISGYSTVLNQAYHNGTCVVIDDVTDPEAYKKLVELDYVMLRKKHRLLSKVLGEL